MTLENYGITFVAECDFCSETLDTDEYTFHDGIVEMKRQGWQVFKQKGEWMHKCPCCIEDRAEADFG